MGRLTPDEFRKKYAELPPNLREAYGSVKTTEILEEIGKKHGLLLDQIGALVDETGFMMLGATHPNEYVVKLKDALGIPLEKTKAIAMDVNEQVFKPIREALKQVHKMKEGSAGEEPSPMPPSPQYRREESARAHAMEGAKNTEEPLLGTPPQEKLLAPSAVQQAPSQSFSEERLKKAFSIPPQERVYKVSADNKEIESVPANENPKKRYEIDPYREPVG